jgi:hypothetical protein
MRLTNLLAALAVTSLALATPAAAVGTDSGQQGPPIVDFGTPCFKGGFTLVVYGKEVFRCWKPLGNDDSEATARCASEVCSLVNAACTIATKPVTKRDCVLVE